MSRSRMARFALVAVAVLAATLLGRRWPKDQTVHYVLGDAASQVEEVDVRWSQAGASRKDLQAGDPPADEDWTREASFRYAPGQAPRVVTHELRLADGSYTVEFNIASSSKYAAQSVTRVRRHLTLTGGATSIELSSSLADVGATEAAARHQTFRLAPR